LQKPQLGQLLGVRRRDVFSFIGGALVALPRAARAQQPSGKILAAAISGMRARESQFWRLRFFEQKSLRR